MPKKAKNSLDNKEEKTQAKEVEKTEPKTNEAKEEASKNPNLIYDANGNPVSNVYYDSNGNPVSVPVMPAKPALAKSEPEKKIGVFVASIITLLLAIACAVTSVLLNLSVFQDSGSSTAGAVITIIVYFIFGLGALTFVPGIAFSIAALTCSIISIRSCKKGIKAFGIINTILSVLILLFTIMLPVLFLLLLSSGV